MDNNNLPANVSIWSKISSFLTQDITDVSLTPKQEKFFGAVNDFWTQEVTMSSMKSFWLQEVEIKDDIVL